MAFRTGVEWSVESPPGFEVETQGGRTELLRLADKLTNDTMKMWTGKLQPEIGNVKPIRENLELMIKDLKTLKEIRLFRGLGSIDDRIQKQVSNTREERAQYFDSMAAVPTRLLKRLERLEGSGDYYSYSKDPLHIDPIDFLARYTQPIIVIDDGAVALKKAEQFREGKSVEDLNTEAERISLEMHLSLSRGQELEDKSPQQIGNIVWSVADMMYPIVQVDDETVLYHNIAVGHPKIGLEYEKRLPSINGYIESVRRSNTYNIGDRYTIPVGKHKMTMEYMGDGEWLIYMCFPGMLSVFDGPEIAELLLRKSREYKESPKGANPFVR